MPGPVFPKGLVFLSKPAFFSGFRCADLSMLWNIHDARTMGQSAFQLRKEAAHLTSTISLQRWWRRLNELKPKPGGFLLRLP